MTLHSKYVNDGPAGESRLPVPAALAETSGPPRSALCSLIQQEKPPITRRDKSQRTQGVLSSPTRVLSHFSTRC